jgi:hypothetical protein
MRKIQLSENQQILFYNFLTWACKEEPKNFTEWGEQYVLLSNLNYDLTNYIQSGLLKCSKNEAWAIQNYFQIYIDEIFEKRLGEDLFNESKELFILIHKELYKSKHPYFIFIPSSYNCEQEKIIVNPLDSPERYLA